MGEGKPQSIGLLNGRNKLCFTSHAQPWQKIPSTRPSKDQLLLLLLVMPPMAIISQLASEIKRDTCCSDLRAWSHLSQPQTPSEVLQLPQLLVTLWQGTLMAQQTG